MPGLGTESGADVAKGKLKLAFQIKRHVVFRKVRPLLLIKVNPAIRFSSAEKPEAVASIGFMKPRPFALKDGLQKQTTKTIQRTQLNRIRIN